MVKQQIKTYIRKQNIWCCVSICLVLLTGCSMLPVHENDVTPTPTTVVEPQNNAPDSDENSAPRGYVFVYDDVEIAMDMAAEDILIALGEPQSYFEAASCATEGKIRTYGYGSFEVDTYEIDEKEYISCVFFKDDTITTAEGAYIFMPQEQLFSIYGEDYTEEAGMLVYFKENMKLKFILTEQKVSSIQYCSCVTEVKQ